MQAFYKIRLLLFGYSPVFGVRLIRANHVLEVEQKEDLSTCLCGEYSQQRTGTCDDCYQRYTD